LSTALPNARVEPAAQSDLARTARLHHQSLPEGFFARLGTRFLRRYHQVFAESPEAQVLVIRGRRGPAGMLVGTFDNAAHYRWAVRRRGLLLLAAGIVAMLGRPALAIEFLRTRTGRYARALWRALRSRRSARATRREPPRRVAVLTHVAVDPEARGAGAGRELVDEFVERARDRGADEVRLITRAGGAAADFYRRLGWRPRGRRRASDDSVVEEFVLPL
jgi:ribosomal protein S18 acetylase RimI-like enzyme